MQLRSIFLTALVVGIAWFWVRSKELKRVALLAASGYCRELDLALLDESVVTKKMSLQKDEVGQLRIKRTYLFDFTSTGEDRYKGEIIMLAHRVLKITLQPHRIQ